MTETVARRRFNIGGFELNPGDVVSDEVAALLPSGRMKQLVDQGWLSLRPVAGMVGLDRLEVLLAEQTARVDALEERIAALEARRGPGRPRKVEDDGV
jgi:hypothetical protein